MDLALIAGLLQLTLATATPIALGAYAGLFSERSGVVNIAIEGMMLTGAMVAALVSAYTDSLFLGVVAGLLSGALMAALHAVLSIRFKMDQIISGTVINFLAAGLTGHMYQIFLVPPRFPGSAGTFRPIDIPLLSEIPFIGTVLFQHQPIVYAMIILSVVIHYVLFFTPWGLRTRAVGEHPQAADTLGINVYFMRYANVMIGGLLAGLAGIWLTLEWVGAFNINMTNGRGFIALAALIFGRWTPFGAFGAALLFGLANAFQIRMQINFPQIPAEFFQMLPYVLTILVAALARPVPPAAVGQPYEKE
ncbi:MAG: ABC transporter permease [Chloroflexi bacterium]|nr:ABC transporter permease [Chloroflexota bacterium]MCI0580667.1 ABC transporter permease [Chloroflexota bacterium]MCI0648683.1 ABC transporter permease [Chloroflexota bacterium]MCI0728091.1 ABC transporter permease [Chloroflexota bacterium]